jgi:hypothetical protein
VCRAQKIGLGPTIETIPVSAFDLLDDLLGRVDGFAFLREAAFSRGELTDSEWLILNHLLPDRGEPGPAIANKRRIVNGILWGSAHPARPGGRIRQLEFGLRALHTLEQAGRVGCSVRNAGESRSS